MVCVGVPPPDDSPVEPGHAMGSRTTFICCKEAHTYIFPDAIMLPEIPDLCLLALILLLQGPILLPQVLNFQLQPEQHRGHCDRGF